MCNLSNGARALLDSHRTVLQAPEGARVQRVENDAVHDPFTRWDLPDGGVVLWYSYYPGTVYPVYTRKGIIWAGWYTGLAQMAPGELRRHASPPPNLPPLPEIRLYPLIPAVVLEAGIRLNYPHDGERFEDHLVLGTLEEARNVLTLMAGAVAPEVWRAYREEVPRG